MRDDSTNHPEMICNKQSGQMGRDTNIAWKSDPLKEQNYIDSTTLGNKDKRGHFLVHKISDSQDIIKYPHLYFIVSYSVMKFPHFHKI